MHNYAGILVEESLEDNRVLNDLNVVRVRISQETDPAQRWHLYKVMISEDEIKDLAKRIKKGWYSHFWKDDEMIVVFKDKTFTLSITDKKTWNQAIDYGLSVGISREQLDFERE